MDRAEGTAPEGDAASPGRGRREVGVRERRLEEGEGQVAKRERTADERERAADQRERAADQRERAAEKRERAAQAVEEADKILETSQDRVRRTEASLNRAYAHAARQQASIARSVKRNEQQRDFTDLAHHVAALRERTAAAAARLAETEELVARVHDSLAANNPENPGHKRLANEAREAMRQAREIERKYSSS